MVVIPEGGGVLLERVGAGAGLAGEEPVCGKAVVFGGDAGAVEMGDGADVGDVVPQPCREWSMGRKCWWGSWLTHSIWSGWLVRASMSGARAEVGWRRLGVGPEAGGWDVAVDLGMDLAHGDAERWWPVGRRTGRGSGSTKGGSFQGVEHGLREVVGGGGCLAPWGHAHGSCAMLGARAKWMEASARAQVCCRKVRRVGDKETPVGVNGTKSTHRSTVRASKILRLCEDLVNRVSCRHDQCWGCRLALPVVG